MPAGKKADQVRKIKIVMTFVVVALCISIAAGAVLAWIEIEQPFAEEPSSAPVSSQPPGIVGGGITRV